MSVNIPKEELVSVRFSKIGPDGVGALILLCLWSDSQEVDGNIPAEVPKRIGVTKRHLRILLESGEIEPTDDGFRVVHYGRYCESSARLAEVRAFARQRKQKHRAETESPYPTSRTGFSGAVTPGHTRESRPEERVRNGGVPVPTLPDPTLTLPDPTVATAAVVADLVREELEIVDPGLPGQLVKRVGDHPAGLRVIRAAVLHVATKIDDGENVKKAREHSARPLRREARACARERRAR